MSTIKKTDDPATPSWIVLKRPETSNLSMKIENLAEKSGEIFISNHKFCLIPLSSVQILYLNSKRILYTHVIIY